jgi:undecaprenyl-diphosphatase
VARGRYNPASPTVNALRQLIEWDTAARVWMTTHHHPVADTVMVGLSIIGRGGAVWFAILLALVLMDRSRLRAAGVVVAALALAFAMTDLAIKPIVARARPFEAAVATRVIDRRPLTYSFPSGHAASSFAAAVTLSRLWPAGGGALWVLAILVSLSRIYVGVHYPLDVIGGAILGIASAWIAHRAIAPRLPATSA